MPRVYKKRQKIDDISALVETHTDSGLPVFQTVGVKYVIRKQDCRNVAKKYKTRQQFREHAKSFYNRAKREGWVEEITKHFDVERISYGTWQCVDTLREEAQKYTTKTQFMRNSPSAYRTALYFQILDDLNDWQRPIRKSGNTANVQ